MKQKREACILTTVLLYDSTTNKAYYSDLQPISGTLLCKTAYAMQYPFADSNTNEAEELINFLAKAKLLHSFQDYGLYAWVYHGKNEISYEQFSALCIEERLVDEETARWLSAEITKEYQVMDSN
jgi:hypothetical protein